MATGTICSDIGAQENKICSDYFCWFEFKLICSQLFSIILKIRYLALKHLAIKVLHVSLLFSECFYYNSYYDYNFLNGHLLNVWLPFLVLKSKHFR